jgi:hypothetical protein
VHNGEFLRQELVVSAGKGQNDRVITLAVTRGQGETAIGPSASLAMA